MADDKKKMSVADILAAARKADSQSGDASAAPEAPPHAEAPAADSTAAEAPKPKPAKSAGGGRPSVAEMLAMARAEKAEGGGEKPAAKPTPKPAAKPAAKKAAPKPSSKGPAAKSAAGPRDTASILAAARKTTKPGPMSKAEAAALKTEDDKPAKKRVELPPMPVKPAYAQRPAPKKSRPKQAAAGAPERRGFLSTGFTALGAVCVAWTFAAVRFMFPNIVREPPSRFKVGFPDAFPPGSVETKFKAQYGVWIVSTEYNGEQQLAALKTVCTHLGCTPNWLEAEQKFKCPCHGSGFYKDGINFEGPAPRPLERYAIRIADDGQIEIDKSRIFQEEMGQWTDPSCYVPV